MAPWGPCPSFWSGGGEVLTLEWQLLAGWLAPSEVSRETLAEGLRPDFEAMAAIG